MENSIWCWLVIATVAASAEVVLIAPCGMEDHVRMLYESHGEIGNAYYLRGVLELYCSGSYHGICPTSFSNNDGDVYCRSIHFQGKVKYDLKVKLTHSGCTLTQRSSSAWQSSIQWISCARWL